MTISTALKSLPLDFSLKKTRFIGDAPSVLSDSWEGGVSGGGLEFASSAIAKCREGGVRGGGPLSEGRYWMSAGRSSD